MDYTSNMAKAGSKQLNMNIDEALLDRIEKYRFKRMFQSRSEAIEFLLDYALKANPPRLDEDAKN